MRSDLLRRTTGSSSSPATRFVLLSSLFLLLHLISSADTPTAYDKLLEYDFPVGLLPQGVTGYDLNTETGAFKVYMKETCSFKIQGYNLKYKSTITGVIEKGKLKNLKGINVKILVVWLNIVEVSRLDDQIDFSVGIMSAGFEYSNRKCYQLPFSSTKPAPTHALNITISLSHFPTLNVFAGDITPFHPPPPPLHRRRRDTHGVRSSGRIQFSGRPAPKRHNIVHLDEDTRESEVNLDDTCEFSVQGYDLKYE